MQTVLHMQMYANSYKYKTNVNKLKLCITVNN